MALFYDDFLRGVVGLVEKQRIWSVDLLGAVDN